MAIAERIKHTAKDNKKLQEEPPYYQLIEGEIIVSPSPTPEHQEVSINLSYILYDIVKRAKKGRVFASPIDVYLDQENVFQPDIVVVLKEGKAKITKKGIEGPPDIVVEILSPSTAYYDFTVKKDVYERAGVKEYWLLDPLRKTFEIYANSQEGFKLISKAKEEGMVSSELLGLKLNLKQVFE